MALSLPHDVLRYHLLPYLCPISLSILRFVCRKFRSFISLSPKLTLLNLSQYNRSELWDWAYTNKCYWDRDLWRTIIKEGNDELVKWAYLKKLRLPDLGFAVNSDHFIYGWSPEQNLLQMLTFMGNLEMLQWLVKTRRLHLLGLEREVIFETAALKHHWPILEYIIYKQRRNQYPFNPAGMCRLIKQKCSLEVLKWCKTKRIPFDATCMRAAMETNQLDVVQWLSYI
jgi:hypothetical protein